MGDVGNGDDDTITGPFFWRRILGSTPEFTPRGLKPERSVTVTRFDYGTAGRNDFYLRLGPNRQRRRHVFRPSQFVLDGHAGASKITMSFGLRAPWRPHMNHITPAVLFVGGWFDAEDLAGPLKLFARRTRTAKSAPA